MTDRMKEAVYSSLGEMGGLTVLDLYAGSGSLGLEALSRGAKKAFFVENARDAIVKLKENIEATGFEGSSEVIWAEVMPTLQAAPRDRVDLIFVDPPYGMAATGVLRDLETLVMNGYLSDRGRIVVHRPAKESTLAPLGLKQIWHREFGQSQIYVFTHEDEEDE